MGYLVLKYLYTRYVPLHISPTGLSLLEAAGVGQTARNGMISRVYDDASAMAAAPRPDKAV